jgi:hypothetical protein
MTSYSALQTDLYEAHTKIWIEKIVATESTESTEGFGQAFGLGVLCGLCGLIQFLVCRTLKRVTNSLQSPASFGDQPHRRLAHPILIMKPLAPS